MKFNLQINPEWKVVDAQTGLQVKRVLWVDDETHAVAQCKCALTCDKNILAAALMGGNADEVYQTCLTPDKNVRSMPKVKLDQPRKTVLVNVNDAIKPEENIDEADPVYGEHRVVRVLILA